MTHRKQRYRNTSTCLRARFITSTAPPPPPVHLSPCCAVATTAANAAQGPQTLTLVSRRDSVSHPSPLAHKEPKAPPLCTRGLRPSSSPSGSVLWPQNLQVDSTTHFPGLSHHSGTPATHRCGRAMLAFFLSLCTKCFEAELDRVRDRGWPARCC